jgi:hypothetical protein
MRTGSIVELSHKNASCVTSMGLGDEAEAEAEAEDEHDVLGVTEDTCCDPTIVRGPEEDRSRGEDRLERSQARLLKKIGRMETRHAEHRASSAMAEHDSNSAALQRVSRFPLHRAVADGQSASVPVFRLRLREVVTTRVIRLPARLRRNRRTHRGRSIGAAC